MSKRIYQSGALKRKEKAEKDEKERRLLEKIPKLSDIFRPTDDNSQMSSASSSTDFVENTNITVESELENAMEIDIENRGESSFQQLSIATTSSNIESNDPGLWDIQSNQKSLQSYWVKHGKLTSIISIVMRTI